MNLAVIGLMFLVLALALFGGKIYSHLQSCGFRLKGKK